MLGVDRKERRQWENILAKLVPYRIGRYGQLLEWSTDIDDPKDEHRHVNHLFGLHPGHTISPLTTPELAKAAKVVLEHRGDGGTGWSMGWKLNQWARLQDGNHAYKLYNNLLSNGTLTTYGIAMRLSKLTEISAARQVLPKKVKAIPEPSNCSLLYRMHGQMVR